MQEISNVQYQLKKSLETAKLYNSWLIDTQNAASALAEAKNFVKNTLFQTEILLENHPDFKLVTKQRDEGAERNINVDQIKDLKQFLNKTAEYKYKVAIIYQADLMNSYATNSCLKILEDTPKDSYIFLITTKAATILPTIRSRCVKLNDRIFKKDFTSDNYQQLISPIIRSEVNSRLKFMKECAERKDGREVWMNFAYSVLDMIARMTKYSVGSSINLNETEKLIMSQLKTNKLGYLIEKFEKASSVIKQTINLDLELRCSYILLIDELKE